MFQSFLEAEKRNCDFEVTSDASTCKDGCFVPVNAMYVECKYQYMQLVDDYLNS